MAIKQYTICVRIHISGALWNSNNADSDLDSIYFIHKVTIWRISSATSIKAPKSDPILVSPEIVFNSLFIELRLGELNMITSSNGNIFRVTGPLCGEFTGPGEFPTQRPLTRSFDVFFDLRLNKRLSKQPWGWWFETLSWSLWCQCNVCQ